MTTPSMFTAQKGEKGEMRPLEDFWTTVCPNLITLSRLGQVILAMMLGNRRYQSRSFHQKLSRREWIDVEAFETSCDSHRHQTTDKDLDFPLLDCYSKINKSMDKQCSRIGDCELKSCSSLKNLMLCSPTTAFHVWMI
ncbi:hypothetical protein AC1031_018303 [Aphanomyces cochlioides]|nr:hypothetical protein AC1031_018303 [Aphanomyces cochlioides]